MAKVPEDISLDGMSEREILAKLISRTRKYEDPLKVADELLADYGTLYEVLNVRPKKLIAYNGIDEHTATLIALMPALKKAYFKSKNNKVRFLRKTEDIKRYVENYLKTEYRECFLLICLNERYRILESEIIAHGDFSQTNVSERKLIERLITYRSKKAIIAHNHPRSEAMPSPPDVYATKSIEELLDFAGIELLDHIIVGEDGVISMKYDTDFLKPIDDD